MRAVLQRVKWANVVVDGKVVGEIKNGICALIGISMHDTEKDMEYTVDQILKAPMFERSGEKELTVHEMDYEILCSNVKVFVVKSNFVCSFTVYSVWENG
ncbi:hypothetical protein BB559_003420 [Furculomyces boomerangus]|uniref:D-aminoacyl-tRNA deacylase n=1 Tax=Furculomyces boomerangus TaxID=61424 RepID=A0A2T9YLF3_9FUNG|nr:hypothetical protein BB559_003420 [Furculomyces boomerangus]